MIHDIVNSMITIYVYIGVCALFVASALLWNPGSGKRKEGSGEGNEDGVYIIPVREMLIPDAP